MISFVALGKPATVLPPGELEYFPARAYSALGVGQPAQKFAAAEAAVTAAKAKLELAKREWIPDPTISVEAQRYNGASQVASEVDAGVSFNVPWLNGKKYRAEEKEAANGVDAAQQALESARAAALGLLRDQLQKIETAHHHVELFQTRLIPTARQTVQTNRANYESGKTGFLDLVVSDRNLRELEAMFQEHLADYQIAVADLQALVGSDLSSPSSHRKASKGESK